MKAMKFGIAASLCLAASLAAPSASAQKPKDAKSTAKDRSKVSITIYNQNFGLVREIRKVKLGTGRIALDFQGVASQIQPETVHIRSLSGINQLNVLEQNYRYDLLTPNNLLQKYVGKKLKVYRYNEKLGREEMKEAKLLSYANNRPVLEIDGQITFGFGGRFAFPSMPKSLIPKPTLVWMLDSKRAEQEVEVTYLTRAITWEADYVLVVNKDDTAGDLTGWVTLRNNTGASYENASLKLVAGDVQRLQQRYSRRGMAKSAPGDPLGGASFKEESFFEYHLYSLQRPTNVLEKENKQVTLLDAPGAKVDKKLIFYGQQYWYRGRHGQLQSNQKVGVYLDLKNSKANNLGMPLPKGTVRVYKADKSGSKQFIGEDRIDHTPRDEKVRIKMGDAFDVVGDRKQTDWDSLGRCAAESEWEVQLRNHKDKAEKVQIFEPVGGDWTIVKSSHPHKKHDAFTFMYDVKVPARGKTTIKYRVRVKWC